MVILWRWLKKTSFLSYEEQFIISKKFFLEESVYFAPKRHDFTLIHVFFNAKTPLSESENCVRDSCVKGSWQTKRKSRQRRQTCFLCGFHALCLIHSKAHTPCSVSWTLLRSVAVLLNISIYKYSLLCVLTDLTRSETIMLYYVLSILVRK